MDEEVDDLRSRLKEAQDSLERETLTKVDLQNQIQSLREEMTFTKRVHDEVMCFELTSDHFILHVCMYPWWKLHVHVHTCGFDVTGNFIHVYM